ncbi:Glycosyltransferase, group 4 family [uncultured Desulfobacterium sp.]|uniref:Glycosyltransferase, group 4 family n=1 Tax=uncultured Desulfobacterium sp. TaxID=201089 RepID=A0A445MUJ6_9BACT|nr:Glycosyltransferase, group 4 family [uncultured Desulfobacterium sp.]
MIFLPTILISMFITICVMPFLRRLAVRFHAIDIPDERKVHVNPVPKCGGIGIALGALVPIILWAPEDLFVRAVLIGAGIITVFGLADDFLNLGYKAKFFGQISAALVVILYGGIKITSLGALLPDGVLLPEWLAILLSIIVIVGVTNAINLSDGLDGLAGGTCLLIFLCIGYLAYCIENSMVSIMAFAVVGALFGFLRFNTYPATLFMGDAGSQMLGFLAITLSLGITQPNTAFSPILPILLLGFPVLDTLTVMIERMAEGKSPFVADKKHFHHRLIGLNLYHTESVFTIYIIQCFLITSAFFLRFYSGVFLLIYYFAFSVFIISGFFVAEKAGWKLRRPGLEKSVKGRLKVLRETNIHIKFVFRVLHFGVPLLVIFSCLAPKTVPLHLAILSLGFIVLLFITRLLKEKWLSVVMGISLYIFVPFAIYTGENDMASWLNGGTLLAYNLSFAVLALFTFLTLRFTRRTRGFGITPMHFLIIFIALVVPNLPNIGIEKQSLGMIATKMIVLFFGYEVLTGELRGNTNKLWLGINSAMGVMAVRGLGNF